MILDVGKTKKKDHVSTEFHCIVNPGMYPPVRKTDQDQAHCGFDHLPLIWKWTDDNLRSDHTGIAGSKNISNVLASDDGWRKWLIPNCPVCKYNAYIAMAVDLTRDVEGFSFHGASRRSLYIERYNTVVGRRKKKRQKLNIFNHPPRSKKWQ